MYIVHTSMFLNKQGGSLMEVMRKQIPKESSVTHKRKNNEPFRYFCSVRSQDGFIIKSTASVGGA